MVKVLQTPMGFIPNAIGACVLLPLISQFAAAQQDQTMAATASAPAKSDACTASTGKAYALCMRGVSSTSPA
jgi:hypothetical protein